jgi:hypothetical protein
MTIFDNHPHGTDPESKSPWLGFGNNHIST